MQCNSEHTSLESLLGCTYCRQNLATSSSAGSRALHRDDCLLLISGIEDEYIQAAAQANIRYIDVGELRRNYTLSNQLGGCSSAIVRLCQPLCTAK